MENKNLNTESYKYSKDQYHNNKPAVKSTSCSSYNPEIKDGRGGNASERGPEIWVKKWVDYSSKYGLG